MLKINCTTTISRRQLFIVMIPQADLRLIQLDLVKDLQNRPSFLPDVAEAKVIFQYGAGQRPSFPIEYDVT